MRFSSFSKSVLALCFVGLFSSLTLAAPPVPPVKESTNFGIDVAHSRIGFGVKHMVINTVYGNFNKFTGIIHFDEKDITKSSVEVTIKVDSINTNNEGRDKHLRSADFFDVEKFPEITFKSTKIVKKGKGYECIGQFTMHGVTQNIAFPFIINGPVTIGGKPRMGIEASLTLNRQLYGVSWSKKLDTGGAAVDDNVNITLNIEAVKQDAPKQ